MNSEVELESSEGHAETAVAPRNVILRRRSFGQARPYREAYERFQSECREAALARLQQVDVWANCEPEEGSQEEFIHKLIFDAAVSLEEATRSRNVCRSIYVEDAAKRQAMEAERLGGELMFHPDGPAGLYSEPRFSRSEPDAPETTTEKIRHPAVLVEELEQTAAGCRWLLEKWDECRENLARLTIRVRWDNFTIMHLMGKQLVDAFDDPEAAEIYLASHAVDPRSRNPFAELRKELRIDEMKTRLLRARASGAFRQCAGRCCGGTRETQCDHRSLPIAAARNRGGAHEKGGGRPGPGCAGQGV